MPATDGFGPDDGRHRLALRLRQQGQACRQLDAPFYAELMHRTAEDLEAGGPSLAVLAGYSEHAGPFALALRLFGAVHAMVLRRECPDLALHYESVGGDGDAGAAWPALRRLYAERPDDLRAGLEQPPQTNEVGRAGALMGGLLRVVADVGLPVVLREVGASAGLNLRADHFWYSDGSGRTWGPAGSPVRLPGAWAGVPLPLHAPLQVVSRAGCDLHPVDATTTEGRLLLSSYLWPGQRERWDRLRGAMDLAARVPVELDRADAVTWLRTLAPTTGAVTVVWHSVMRQYLGAAGRQELGAELARLLSRASRHAPVAVLSMEPERRSATSEHEMLVSLELAGGADRVVPRRRTIATTRAHGVPTTWE